MKGLRIGIGFCGSFCTYKTIFEQLELLLEEEALLFPVFSFQAQKINSRFGKADDFLKKAKEMTGHTPITTIEGAEPIGPKEMLDLFLIAPCTGNTLAKLANGITDSPVLMAAKSQLRIGRPVLIFLSTNDALSMNLKNIGLLINTKNIYFVPFKQDNCKQKPFSLVSDANALFPAINQAMEGKQLQPVLWNA